MATRTVRRREIDVLRALAVTLVVVHHVWTGKVSGGVDVFFLLSGLLLTLSFLHRVDPGPGLPARSWSLRQTVAARFARLLPLMAVVLVAVLAAAAALVPPLRWHTLLQQTVASITFTQNHVLADLAVDYYATNRASAPILQHNWSMAITGQVYVLLPLLFGVVVLVARRTRLTAVPVLTGLMIIVLGGSLTASVLQTAADPARAYFLTVPRLWEFAAGALLAVVVHRYGDRLSRWGAGPGLQRAVLPVLSWVGVIGLVACGFLQPTPSYFPGLLSWWPIGAAAAIVVAGDCGPFGMAARLDGPVARWLSTHSFGLFLWHWPVLVLWQQTFERHWATWYDGVAVVMIALVLTWAGDRVVARSTALLPRRRVAVLAAALAIVLLPVLVWNGALARQSQTVAAQTVDDNPGARALRAGYVDNTSPGSRVAPFDADVEQEWATLPDSCVLPDGTDPLVAETCREYRPEGEPTRTVVVLGDSRSQQWTAALEPVAKREGWHVMAVTLHQCAFTGPRDDLSALCNDVNTAARQWVLDLEPDAVMSVATRTSPDEAPEHVEAEYLPGVEPFLAAGIQVVGLRDTPRFDFDVPECVQRHGAESDRCEVPRSQVLSEVSPLTGLTADPGWSEMDLNPRICPTDRCPGVVGNVYVYMDLQHLSRTYVATMSPYFGWEWSRVTGWSPQ